MSIEGLIGGAVLLLLTLFVVAQPLLGRRANGAPITQRIDELTTEYDRILNNLRDLEEDFNTGKLQEADYLADREIWTQRGVETLKALDELRQGKKKHARR
jgi:hypothetical protein